MILTRKQVVTTQADHKVHEYTARAKQAKAVRRVEEKETQEINGSTIGLAGLNTPGLGPVPSIMEAAGIRLTVYFQAHKE